MRIVHKLFAIGYSGIILLLICCGISLILFAALRLWHGINPSEALPLRERFNAVLESIGVLTIAAARRLKARDGERSTGRFSPTYGVTRRMRCPF